MANSITIELYTIAMNYAILLSRRRQGIAFTGQHRQAGIFREARVGGRKLAEHEDRAACRLDETRMKAIRAQTSIGLRPIRLFLRLHRESLFGTCPGIRASMMALVWRRPAVQLAS